MDLPGLEAQIEEAWESRETISPATTGPVRQAVESVLDALDRGELRVAEPRGGTWIVNQWAKKAVLLGFRLKDMEPQPGGPQNSTWWDKVDSKFRGWGSSGVEGSRFPGSPELHREALGAHCPGGRADAELRQSRSPCR